ncbi:MAG: adenosylmethionine--8-amino-7-oxononanoate transaminase [Microbacteriaceae bacterium]|nr:adenosylmethionine--8-amino-7-oxononanoate transaminase [Microbacteriaceae bacterium]
MQNAAGQIQSGKSLIERDRGLLWHPYAPLTGTQMYAVRGAAGSTLNLHLPDGRETRVLDAMSSWWCQVHGYKNPVLDAALSAQAERFSHVMFGGLTHEPAVVLAEKLRQIAPGDLDHVFLADSGSVSVEVALKLAVQYQLAQGRGARRRFIALRGGYHGDTTGAMGVSDPIGGMHAEFAGLVASQNFLPRPPAAVFTPETGEWRVDAALQTAWENEVSSLVAEWATESAAIILEPILQGAGGMHIYHPDCLKLLRGLATEHDILLIFDEIATGFGRTGRLFASDWAGIVPDVMTVGKALTGGYLTMGAVLANHRVAEVIGASEHRALMHGPTFMGNPLSSAVASAAIDLVLGERGDTDLLGIDTAVPSSAWETQVPRLSAALTAGLKPARDMACVQDVRVLGGVGVIELHEPADVAKIAAAAIARGVWVRPFRNLVYIMPTYICTDTELETLCTGLVGAVAEVHEK